MGKERKNKIYIIFAMVAVGIMLAYTAATIAQEETADERSITIGTELDYPPYSFFDKENNFYITSDNDGLYKVYFDKFR